MLKQQQSFLWVSEKHSAFCQLSQSSQTEATAAGFEFTKEPVGFQSVLNGRPIPAGADPSTLLTLTPSGQSKSGWTPGGRQAMLPSCRCLWSSAPPWRWGALPPHAAQLRVLATASTPTPREESREQLLAVRARSSKHCALRTSLLLEWGGGRGASLAVVRKHQNIKQTELQRNIS